MTLPEIDAFGKRMPQGPFVLVTLSGCGSCSLRQVPSGTFAATYRLPIVIATRDDPKETLKELHIQRSAGIWVFQDSNGSATGLGMTFYSPRAALVGSSNRFTSVDMESPSVGEFISMVAK